MNDLTLRKCILDELEFDPSIHAAHIGVTVEDGVVTLTGHVGSYAEKMNAETVVQRIKGVRAIAQEIEVRLPEDKKTADDQIAHRALSIIAWDTTIAPGSVKVEVQKGWVTLTGRVEWQFQRQAADSAVRKLTGVVGVSNRISVRPRVEPADVKRQIESALKRNAELEADGIIVDVQGNKVILRGTVHAWNERVAAERAAWAAPGVTAVDDHLLVA